MYFGRGVIFFALCYLISLYFNFDVFIFLFLVIFFVSLKH